MDEKNTVDQYIEHINANILPFIDYHKLHASYETDMVYAKGILNRLHEAMVKVYGGEQFDEQDGDEGFAIIPGVVRGRESGKLCLALLEFDLSSSGEHWGTSYLCRFGVISQLNGEKDPAATKAMNAALVPYSYGYTASLPDDIHVDIDDLPVEIAAVLNDFRDHHAVLRNEQEPLKEQAAPAADNAAPAEAAAAMDETEFADKMAELLPGADSGCVQKLIGYAKELDADEVEPKGDFFKNTLIEYYLVSQQYGQELALRLLDITKIFTMNPFEIRGAAMQLRNGKTPEEIEQLAYDGECDPPDGESLISEEALKEFEDSRSKAPGGKEKPSALEKIREAAKEPKKPRGGKPKRKKTEPEH